MSISISIRVGNLLGAGDPTGAKKSSCVAFGIISMYKQSPHHLFVTSTEYLLPPQLALLYCSRLFYKAQRTTLEGFSQKTSKCAADLSLLLVVYQPLLHDLELWWSELLN